MARLPSGFTSVTSKTPSAQPRSSRFAIRAAAPEPRRSAGASSATRAASTVSGRPATTARARMGGARGTHAAIVRNGALGRIEVQLAFGDLLGVGDQRLVLGHPAQVAALGLGQRREQRAGAQGCQLLGELGGCARTCGQRAAHAVVAGVEPSSMAMMHTPISSSPARMARSMGAAPRQRGSRGRARSGSRRAAGRAPPWGESPRRPPRRWHRARTRRAPRAPRRRAACAAFARENRDVRPPPSPERAQAPFPGRARRRDACRRPRSRGTPPTRPRFPLRSGAFP